MRVKEIFGFATTTETIRILAYAYYSIDSAEWTNIEVSFTADTTYSDTQLILFVRNTDAARIICRSMMCK